MREKNVLVDSGFKKFEIKHKGRRMTLFGDDRAIASAEAFSDAFKDVLFDSLCFLERIHCKINSQNVSLEDRVMLWKMLAQNVLLSAKIAVDNSPEDKAKFEKMMAEARTDLSYIG